MGSERSKEHQTKKEVKKSLELYQNFSESAAPQSKLPLSKLQASPTHTLTGLDKRVIVHLPSKVRGTKIWKELGSQTLVAWEVSCSRSLFAF